MPKGSPSKARRPPKKCTAESAPRRRLQRDSLAPQLDKPASHKSTTSPESKRSMMDAYPRPGDEPLPTLTCSEVRELDSLAIQEFGLPGVVLMENAGRALAQAILEERPELASAMILCGAGNNGGDGYVLARYLAERGVCVTVLETTQQGLSPDAAVFRQVCAAMQLPMLPVDTQGALASCLQNLEPAELVIDALLGTGFQGDLRPAAAAWLAQLNRIATEWKSLRVAIDAPSGLDVDTGQFASDCFRADLTLTLAANKLAYESPISGESGTRVVTGRVRVLPIGIPRAVYDRLG